MMKMHFLPSALVLSLLSAGVMAESSTFFGVPTEFSLGTEAYRQNIDYSNNAGSINHSATMYGVNGDMTMHFTDTHGAKFSGRFARGESDSETKRGDQVIARGGKHNATDYELRGVYQYTANLGGQPLTTSAGMGYRNKYNQLDKGSLKSEFYYATVGLESRFALGDKWSATPSLSYNRLLSGKQQMKYRRNASNATQHSGYGVEVASDFSVKVGSKELSLTPFYRYWNVNATNANVLDGQFPGNKTKEAGLNVSLAL